MLKALTDQRSAPSLTRTELQQEPREEEGGEEVWEEAQQGTEVSRGWVSAGDGEHPEHQLVPEGFSGLFYIEYKYITSLISLYTWN